MRFQRRGRFLRRGRGMLELTGRDACIGINGADTYYSSFEWEDKDEVYTVASGEEEEDDEVDMELEEEEDPLCPTINISKAELTDACRPWRRSIMVKLLGKRLGMRFLRQRLLKMWQPEGSMEMIDLENDYYLIRFSNMEDVMRVFEGGPWMILDHYLLLRRWHPEFFPHEDEFKRVAVWVRIPGLPIEYYDRNILWKIGGSLGNMLKMDGNTLRQKEPSRDDEFVTERAKFARISVEIDLRKVLVSTFKLNGRYYKVEYEGLHQICFHCGRYGHRRNACSLLQRVPEGYDGEQNVEQAATTATEAHQAGENAKTEKNQSDEIFGSWMIAQRKARRNVRELRKDNNNGRKILVVDNDVLAANNSDANDKRVMDAKIHGDMPSGTEQPFVRVQKAKENMKTNNGVGSKTQPRLLPNLVEGEGPQSPASSPEQVICASGKKRSGMAHLEGILQMLARTLMPPVLEVLAQLLSSPLKHLSLPAQPKFFSTPPVALAGRQKCWRKARRRMLVGLLR
ncbi:Zinc finger, CCHC-type [Sesbania bispinosa]|nr:Zinc finger, CCHC-type [Sesbania bispinosa]